MRLPEDDIPSLRSALLAWHRRNGLRAPWRTTGDPYHVLVAATMAQQTQMSRVLLKYDEFLEAFPTVEALARARTATVLRVWGGLGYNLRALRLHRAAKLVVRSGGFPQTAEGLERIEGIGPFTASIISSFAFREPAPAIDTNIRRVLARLAGDAEGRTPDRALLPLAHKLMSRRAPGRWNQTMMDLGGRVCTARAPKCDRCPIARWCRARPLFASGRAPKRVSERRASYRAEPPYEGSRRYYRGRVVEALRALPGGRSLSQKELLARIGRDGLDAKTLDELIVSLQRDGLVRVTADGRVRLP